MSTHLGSVMHLLGSLLLVVVLGLTTACAAPGDVRWRSLPIRSQAEFEQGLPGGEAEQHLQGMTRSAANPDRLYLGHDCGGVWRSDDNGRSWQHTGGQGLFVRNTQSVEADPVNADVVMAIESCAWDYLARNLQGLYRSEDAGATWQLVLHLPEVDNQRSMQRCLTWDPTTLGPREARRWYAGFAGRALYRTDDGGRTWTPGCALTEHRPLYTVVAHPSRAGVLYVGSARGLFLSEDGGASLSPLGDLPAGAVRSIALNPAEPADLYATVDGVGLYRSRDGGRHFQQVKAFKAEYVAVHPTERNRLYLVGRGGAHMLASRDGGTTWQVPKVIPILGWDREQGGWKTHFEGDFSALLPDPRNPDSAVGIANATLYRTEDGGRTLTDSSAGFTGYAWGWFTRPIAFDPVDPNRFAFFCYDVGTVLTTNGGKWFEQHPVPWVWKRDRLIEHTGMYSGGFAPSPGSPVLVATTGMYWHTVLVRTEDGGRTWTIVDGRTRENLFVAFHPKDPQVVYADAQRSDDGGRTFAALPLPPGAVIVGMAPSRPDTVYALNQRRTELFRSDDRGRTWRSYTKPGWALNRLDSRPTFLVSPTDENRVYTIDQQGDLATFDGRAWQSLGVLALAGGQREQGNFVRAVAVDPRHPEVLYAGLHAPGRPCLFRSVDAGRTWVDLSGNLPRIGVDGLVVHPLTGDVFTGGIAGTRVMAPPYDSPNSLYASLAAPTR